MKTSQEPMTKTSIHNYLVSRYSPHDAWNSWSDKLDMHYDDNDGTVPWDCAVKAVGSWGPIVVDKFITAFKSQEGKRIKESDMRKWLEKTVPCG